MGYVQAGYSIVLALIFLYALTLLWRRRRLTRTVDRVLASTETRSVGRDPGGAAP
jgi:uncharacterized protein (TIGR03382 family)